MFHACTYQMDLWANDALSSFLHLPALEDDDDTVTPLDLCMHTALFAVGQDEFNA
jgi:hypothetical protein